MFTWKCASRHNGVHFFANSTSKSGPSMVRFVRFDLEMCFAPQRRALFRQLNFQKWSEHDVLCTFWLENVLRATTACTFSKSQLPKVVRDRQFWTLLTSNGVDFFDISTSKSGPSMVCFVHFDLEMCFAPQRRALFRQLNFQKWSEHGVFLYILTWKCASRHNGVHCFESQLPKVVRAWCALYVLTSKCASRHNGVHFFDIATPKSASAPAALASLLFDPPEPQNHEKTQWIATFLPFRAPASSFFWSFLLWLFSLLTAFSSLHIVGGLTSKLPSIIYCISICNMWCVYNICMYIYTVYHYYHIIYRHISYEWMFYCVCIL